MSQNKVLVIDDEEFIRQLVVDFLELENIQCDEAMDSETGLKQISSNNYDLILLDRNLKDCKAEDIIKQIKEINKTTTIILLTGDHQCDEEYLKNNEIDGIILKPFQIKEFMVEINKHLENR